MRAVEEGRLIAFGQLEPTWIYYYGAPIKEYFIPSADEVASLLAQPGTYVITNIDTYDEFLKPKAPPGTEVIERVPYYMRFTKGDLILVGRK